MMIAAHTRSNFLKEIFQLLGGYFGDQSIEEGVEEMLFVSLDYSEYHQNWLGIIKNAIDGVDNSDFKILEVIRNTVHISDKSEAKIYLQDLMETYIRRYAEESRSNITT
jgi:hypothetical protein